MILIIKRMKYHDFDHKTNEIWRLASGIWRLVIWRLASLLSRWDVCPDAYACQMHTSPDPSPEASNRVILVRRTLLYTLELPRLSLLKVAARIRRRRRRCRRREQFFTREQGPYQLTHPGTPIIRS